MITKYKLVDGKVIEATDLLDWARWYENFENRIIKKTQVSVEPSVEVSTIFLSIDHNWTGNPHLGPVLFETMVFGGPHDMHCRRYTTLVDALAGHETVVAMVESV